VLVYGALISPFVRKVCLVAEEKGAPWRLEVPNLKAPAADFAAASPFCKIPAIRDGDFALSDSSAIALYLEAKYPAPALLPAAPELRGRAIWFDEYADTILAASGLKVLFNRFVGPKLMKRPGDEAVAAAGAAALPPLYAYLEGQLGDEGWLLGAHFSLADISVAAMLRSFAIVGVAPQGTDYPRIAAWYARVTARPAWAKVAEQDHPATIPA